MQRRDETRGVGHVRPGVPFTPHLRSRVPSGPRLSPPDDLVAAGRVRGSLALLNKHTPDAGKDQQPRRRGRAKGPYPMPAQAPPAPPVPLAYEHARRLADALEAHAGQHGTDLDVLALLPDGGWERVALYANTAPPTEEVKGYVAAVLYDRSRRRPAQVPQRARHERACYDEDGVLDGCVCGADEFDGEPF